MSMGLSGAGLHIKVLAAFSLVLLLYWIYLFIQAFLWDVGCKVVLDHILGPSRSFYCAFLVIGLLGLGFGPLMLSGLGPQISGPTILFYLQNSWSLHKLLQMAPKVELFMNCYIFSKRVEGQQTSMFSTTFENLSKKNFWKSIKLYLLYYNIYIYIYIFIYMTCLSIWLMGCLVYDFKQ